MRFNLKDGYTFLRTKASQLVKKHNLPIITAVIIGITVAWFITSGLRSYATTPIKTKGIIPKEMLVPKATPQAIKPAKPVAIVPSSPPSLASSGNSDKDTPKKVRKITMKKAPVLILNGTLISEDKNLAIINDQIVEVGEEIDGVKILNILSPGQVLVEFEGQEFTIKAQ